MKIYKDMKKLPTGVAGDTITEGCLVLEGGGWKGLYTLGVLDCMMQNDINIRNVVGVSAGALSAVGYITGQIGRGARVDLTYRHDQNFCGIGAFMRDKGITGFSYMFNEVNKAYPIDMKKLNDPRRRFAVSATNLLTGKVTYFENGKCDIFKALQASATVPFVSKPVMIDGVPYLDGGCAEKLPLPWARSCGEKKTVVVRTRELSYRRNEKPSRMARLMYRKYPKFADALCRANANFNRDVNELEKQAERGEVFIIAPSKKVEVKRFDGDMEKLGALYWLGYRDMAKQVKGLKAYLGQE